MKYCYANRRMTLYPNSVDPWALSPDDYTKEFLTVENLELKKLLNQEMSSSSVLKSAKVIVDKNSPFLKSIILNKG